MTPEQCAAFLAGFLHSVLQDVNDSASGEDSENENSPDGEAEVSSDNQSNHDGEPDNQSDSSQDNESDSEGFWIVIRLPRHDESEDTDTSEEDSESKGISDGDIESGPDEDVEDMAECFANLFRHDDDALEDSDDASTSEEDSYPGSVPDSAYGEGPFSDKQSEASAEEESEFEDYAECFANLFGTNDDSQSSGSFRAEFERFMKNALLEAFGFKKAFSGNPLEWTEFWRRFEKYVDTAKNLSKEKPLDVLKRHLVGEARAAIADFTADEYEQAVAVLKEKYGKPEIIEEACMKYVSDMPQLESDDIVELCIFCSNILDNLFYFAVHQDRRAVHSEQLAKELLSKLPDALQDKLSKRDKTSPMTFEKLVDGLLKEVGVVRVLGVNSLFGL